MTNGNPRGMIRILVLVLALAQPAGAASLRVGVMGHYSMTHLKVLNARGPLRVSTSGAESVFAPGKGIDLLACGSRVSVRFQGRETLHGSRVKLSGATIDTPGLPWRRYAGDLWASARNGKLSLVNEVSLEEYVAGVLAAETERGWPLEALKAQAVVSRTFAFSERHRADGYHLCDLTHCQVYHGQVSSPSSERAVRETRGLILAYRNKPAQALFHSTCGGVRAANQWIFGGEALPYLKGGSDVEKGALLCRESPHAAAWNVSVSVSELSKALNARSETEVGFLRSLMIERNPSGFVQRVSLAGDRRRVVDGYSFWLALGQTLGWGEVKSLNFTVAREGDRYRFTGKGLGHGVGLCQWGARKLALSGQSFRLILNRYFPGTVLIPAGEAR